MKLQNIYLKTAVFGSAVNCFSINIDLFTSLNNSYVTFEILSQYTWLFQMKHFLLYNQLLSEKSVFYSINFLLYTPATFSKLLFKKRDGSIYFYTVFQKSNYWTNHCDILFCQITVTYQPLTQKGPAVFDKDSSDM